MARVGRLTRRRRCGCSWLLCNTQLNACVCVWLAGLTDEIDENERYAPVDFKKTDDNSTKDETKLKGDYNALFNHQIVRLYNNNYTNLMQWSMLHIKKLAINQHHW